MLKGNILFAFAFALCEPGSKKKGEINEIERDSGNL